MRLQDKVILVTGSTTGIGEAIARRVVEEGARVVIHGRDEERGRAMVDAVAGAGGAGALRIWPIPARRRSLSMQPFERSAGSTPS